jgi:hypothetical protein
MVETRSHKGADSGSSSLPEEMEPNREQNPGELSNGGRRREEQRSRVSRSRVPRTPEPSYKELSQGMASCQEQVQSLQNTFATFLQSWEKSATPTQPKADVHPEPPRRSEVCYEDRRTTQRDTYGVRQHSHRYDYTTFDGTERWKDFLNHFEFAARLNKETTNLEDRLCCQLRGAAAIFASQLPSTLSYDELTEELAQRFRRQGTPIACHAAAEQRRWSAEEPAADHVDAIRALCEDMLEGVHTNAEAVERMTVCIAANSFTYPSLRAKLGALRITPTTADVITRADATRQAVIFEAKEQRSAQPTSRTVRPDAGAFRPSRPAVRPPRWVSSDQTARPATTTPTCWNCGQTGHISRLCRKKRVRKLEPTNDEDEDDEEEAASGNEQ